MKSFGYINDDAYMEEYLLTAGKIKREKGSLCTGTERRPANCVEQVFEEQDYEKDRRKCRLRGTLTCWKKSYIPASFPT